MTTNTPVIFIKYILTWWIFKIIWYSIYILLFSTLSRSWPWPFSLPSLRWPSPLLLRLTSNVCMHLDKKGILAQASTQEKSADWVPCCLHGFYNEAGSELQGKNRRKHQSDSKSKWYGTFTKCLPSPDTALRALHTYTVSDSWDPERLGYLWSHSSWGHRVGIPTWACLTEFPFNYYTICFYELLQNTDDNKWQRKHS